jgi:hypothetical protein
MLDDAWAAQFPATEILQLGADLQTGRGWLQYGAGAPHARVAFTVPDFEAPLRGELLRALWCAWRAEAQVLLVMQDPVYRNVGIVQQPTRLGNLHRYHDTAQLSFRFSALKLQFTLNPDRIAAVRIINKPLSASRTVWHCDAYQPPRTLHFEMSPDGEYRVWNDDPREPWSRTYKTFNGALRWFRLYDTMTTAPNPSAGASEPWQPPGPRAVKLRPRR